ncbi:GH24139 [Drosophila grimshawi]|uniref:GH24139 n=1 Tax=Drosophila grimshawi TaxID=7222 RepID=B4JNH5_DROGR|nr:GH24139 [Drosophila grimshawi]
MGNFVELLYHEFAVLDWNGTELYGREAIKNHCTALPPSRHHLTSVDCVYLQMNESPNIKLYHVIIGGEKVLTELPANELIMQRRKREWKGIVLKDEEDGYLWEHPWNRQLG